ncbi:MAG: hypothetical protein ABRQ39_01505 [Candidatus Eremiobacterota bacterium]
MLNFREITKNDIPALFAVRVATHENRLTMEELSSLGITEESDLYQFAINFSIINLMALPARRSSEKNLNWNRHIYQSLHHATLHYIPFK